MHWARHNASSTSGTPFVKYWPTANRLSLTFDKRSTIFRMTEETNLQRLHRWFKEVWNERNESTIDELMSPDVKAYGLLDHPVNRDAFKLGWRAFLETFPDITITIEDSLGNENTTSIRVTITGTHLGNGLGMPPTGKKVKFDAQNFARWENGQITEGWNVIDMSAVYRQVGAVLTLE